MPRVQSVEDQLEEEQLAGKARQLSVRAASLRPQGNGRESAFNTDASAQAQIHGLYQQYASLAYWLPWEILDYVELLSTYNPDFSQAVDNIRTLANSGHKLYIDASTPEIAAEVKARIEEKARTVQARNGGVDGLVDKLLDQAAVYGAMCGEWVLNESMDDVIDFAEVNPKSIRFFWHEDTNSFEAYQKVSLLQASEAIAAGQQVRQLNFVQLNPNTFFYYAFDAAPGSPYGVPPFTAALTGIAIQRDMIINMAQIVKKVGLLGIIDFTVKALPMQPGETDEDYSSRANAYLDSYVKAIEDMVKDGGIVHFDDSEANTYNISGNAAGATAIFKQNEELIFSGLKSMPSVQGRSYSTTETYAGVAYDIIIRNTSKYQRAVKRMIENGYWLMVQAWGYTDVTDVRIVWNSNKTLHRMQDAQAELMEIKNSLMLWAAGIINQLDMAQRHGYDSVKEAFDEPPATNILGNGASPGGGSGTASMDGLESGTSDNTTDSTKSFAIIRKQIAELTKMLDVAEQKGNISGNQQKRRVKGRKLSAELLQLQRAYVNAGKKNVHKLQDDILQALDLE